MTCGSNSGRIKVDETPLKYLKIIITTPRGNQRTVVLDNPPNQITLSTTSEDLMHSDWFYHQAAPSLSLSWRDSVSIAEDGYGVDGGTKLYEDCSGEVEKGTVSAAEESSPQPICRYAHDYPIAIKYQSHSPGRTSLVFDRRQGLHCADCNDTTMCVGKGWCDPRDGREYGLYDLACQATRQAGVVTCPNATDCAIDPGIKLEYPSSAFPLPDIEFFPMNSRETTPR